MAVADYPVPFLPFNQALHKVGLRFAQGNLDVENRERWEEVPMKEMMRTGMPTATKSLESPHGHLNTSTPRRNPFWRSLHLIIGMMLTKSTELGSCVRHNFGHEVRESLTRYEIRQSSDAAGNSINNLVNLTFNFK
jgi:hypothetical protein